MAQATLVEMQLQEGQRLIDRLIKEGVAVTAAAWVKETESGDWYLYLATPLVTEDGGKRPAYHRVNAVILEMQREGFAMDPIEKKVIGPHDPIAKDIVANRSSGPTGPPTPFRGSRLGDLEVDEAYIYPRPPTPEEAAGMQLWESGGIELKPGIGQVGLCRVVVIDLGNQKRLQDRRYCGARHHWQSFPGCEYGLPLGKASRRRVGPGHLRRAGLRADGGVGRGVGAGWVGQHGHSPTVP